MATTDSTWVEPDNPGSGDDFFGRLRRWVGNGKLIGTGVALVAATASAGWTGYQHFAKQADLDDLRCALAGEVAVTDKVVEASAKIRGALEGLKTIKDVKELPAEMKESVRDIQDTLKAIDGERSKQRQMRASGRSPCED